MTKKTPQLNVTSRAPSLPKPTSASFSGSRLIYAGENEAAHCSAIVVAKSSKCLPLWWGEQVIVYITYITSCKTNISRMDNTWILAICCAVAALHQPQVQRQSGSQVSRRGRFMAAAAVHRAVVSICLLCSVHRFHRIVTSNIVLLVRLFVRIW